MKTVTLLNATCERDLIIRIFSKFAKKYGSAWTTRLGTLSNWDDCIDDWHTDLKSYDYKTLVNATKSALIVYDKFPPTFQQFENICRELSGFPTIENVIKLMIARNFSHPIVKMVYNKIGGWNLSNMKINDIETKTKSAYALCLADYMLDEKLQWDKLNSHNQQKLLSQDTPKNFSQSAITSFSEQLKKHQESATQQSAGLNKFVCKEFPENKISKSKRDFDYEVFEEYRNYLISLPETVILLLPTKYAYDRTRFLMKIEAHEGIRNNRPMQSHQDNENIKPRPLNGANIYTNWREG